MRKLYTYNYRSTFWLLSPICLSLNLPGTARARLLRFNMKFALALVRLKSCQRRFCRLSKAVTDTLSVSPYTYMSRKIRKFRTDKFDT